MTASWKALLNSVREPALELLSQVPPALRVGRHPIAEYLLHLMQTQELPPTPIPDSWKLGAVFSPTALQKLYSLEVLYLLCQQSLEVEDLFDRAIDTPPTEWESLLSESDLSAILWECVQILEPYSRYEPVASTLFAHTGSAIDTATSSKFDKGSSAFIKSALLLGFDGLMGALQELYTNEA